MVKVKLLKAIVLIGMMYTLPLHSLAASESGDSRSYIKSIPLALSTNMLYDAALVPNLGVLLGTGEGNFLSINWMHAWWSNSHAHRYWRIYGGDIELRRFIGRCSSGDTFTGHHIGPYFSILSYDIQRGRNHNGYQSDNLTYAAGISYGYSIPVARQFNIDFSVGLGYQWGKYKKHHPVDDHDVWQSTHNRRWLGPTRLSISLVWLLNTPKGGRR